MRRSSALFPKLFVGVGGNVEEGSSSWTNQLRRKWNKKGSYRRGLYWTVFILSLFRAVIAPELKLRRCRGVSRAKVENSDAECRLNGADLLEGRKVAMATASATEDDPRRLSALLRCNTLCYRRNFFSKYVKTVTLFGYFWLETFK